MPSTSQHRHPSGRTITFREADHSYTDDRGLPYESVSTIVKTLSEPFAAAAMSAQVSARTGRPATEIAAEWRAKGAAACRTGTRLHAVAEAATRGTDPRAALDALPADSRGSTPDNDAERDAWRVAWGVGDRIRAGSRVVRPEQLLADPDSLTAGTADIIAVRDDGTIIIGDYKTNSEIDRESRFGKLMLKPLEHLHDCHLVKYSLQLHLYRWMLLRAGYFQADTPISCLLIHIPQGAEAETWIPCLDLSAEADIIMRARRKARAESAEKVARLREQLKTEDTRAPARQEG